MHPFVLVPWIKIKSSVKGKRLAYHICGVAKVSDPYPWFAASLWSGSNCLARHAVLTAVFSFSAFIAIPAKSR